MVSPSSFQKKTPSGELGVKLSAGNRGVAPRDDDSQSVSGIARGTLAQNVRAETVNNVRAGLSRKFSGHLRNNFRGEAVPVPAFEMTTAEWNDATAVAITTHMRDEGLSVKELALKIGCSDRGTGRAALPALHRRHSRIRS